MSKRVRPISEASKTSDSEPDFMCVTNSPSEGFFILPREALLRIFIIMVGGSTDETNAKGLDCAELLRIGLTCKLFFELATSNIIWQMQICKTLKKRTNPRLYRAVDRCMRWIDRSIKESQDQCKLRYYPKDNNETERDYILFHPVENESVYDDYEKQPHLMHAIVKMRANFDDIDQAVMNESNENVIAIAIGKLIQMGFDKMNDVIVKNQCDSRAIRLDKALPLSLPIPEISGTRLWYELFRLSALDGLADEMYTWNKFWLSLFWKRIKEVQCYEIASIVTLHAKQEGLIYDMPTMWTRETTPKNTNRHLRCCSYCRMPMPETNVKYSARLLQWINCFNNCQHRFCSSWCLIDALSSGVVYNVQCARFGCTHNIPLSECLGLNQSNFYTKRLAPRGKLEGVLLLPGQVNLDLLARENREHLLESVSKADYAWHHEYDLMTKCAYKLNKPPVFDVSSSYLNTMPYNTDHTAAQESANLSHEAWRDRIQLLNIIRQMLEDQLVPWPYFAWNTASMAKFFPMVQLAGDIRSFSTPAQEVEDVTAHWRKYFSHLPNFNNHTNLDLEAHNPLSSAKLDMFCSKNCQRAHQQIPSVFDNELPAIHGDHCLNPSCNRRFNLVDAPLSLECFELRYRSDKDIRENKVGELRGYVCDYYCRDAYRAARLKNLHARARLQDEQDLKRARTDGSVSPMKC